MHSRNSGIYDGVRGFLGKLLTMIADRNTDHLIKWSDDGHSFVILDQMEFAKSLLSKYYKHNNMASFTRQLNMYGFHKVIASSCNEPDKVEFYHSFFVKGKPYLLKNIKRSINMSSSSSSSESYPIQRKSMNIGSLETLINEIRDIKGKQQNLASQLNTVKRENEILWRELSILRQKHANQQHIVNKENPMDKVSIPVPSGRKQGRPCKFDVKKKTSLPSGKKQGRPCKFDVEKKTSLPSGRKRGRPRKFDAVEEKTSVPSRRKRGRPRKFDGLDTYNLNDIKMPILHRSPVLGMSHVILKRISIPDNMSQSLDLKREDDDASSIDNKVTDRYRPVLDNKDFDRAEFKNTPLIQILTPAVINSKLELNGIDHHLPTSTTAINGVQLPLDSCHQFDSSSTGGSKFSHRKSLSDRAEMYNQIDEIS